MRIYLVNTTAYIHLPNSIVHSFPVSFDVRCEPGESQQKIFETLKGAGISFNWDKEKDVREVPEVLYRTEAYSGSGVRDIMEIIRFEVDELGNVDIPNFILNHYSLSEELQSKLAEFITYCKHGAYTFDENMFRQILDTIGKQKGTPIRYGIWLAEKEIVEQDYLLGVEGEINAYKTSPIILSDLGPDGFLFAYAEMPRIIIQ